MYPMIRHYLKLGSLSVLLSKQNVYNLASNEIELNMACFNQVFNENRVIVMLKLAAGGRASTFGFRSITLVCFGQLTPNLLYG